MPELRKDPVVGRWVIVATERARRPGNIVDAHDIQLEEDDNEDCPFCKKPDEVIYSKKGINVVPSSYLRTTDEYNRSTHGLYDVARGILDHEVVIESEDHVASMADLDEKQIELTLKVYADRVKELEKNKNFKYVNIYKNYGSKAGSRKIGHTRSHIIATPVLPLYVKDKLDGAKDYFEANGSCVYCDMVSQEKSSDRVILESKHFLAIVPFAARFLFEVWVLPKKHNCDFHIGIKGKEADLAKLLKTILLKIKDGLEDPAYNVVVQTAPYRRESSNSNKWKTIEEDFHWHIEILPRLTSFAGFEKGTGFHICSIPPESMAQHLREVNV